MAIGERHYPPAYYRYRERHPSVPVRVSKELKAALDMYRGDLSYGKAIKKLLEEKTDFLKEKAEVDAFRKKAAAAGYKEGFDKGYKEGRRIQRFRVPCNRCGEPMTLTSKDTALWQESVKPKLDEAFASWHHTKCPGGDSSVLGLA